MSRLLTDGRPALVTHSPPHTSWTGSRGKDFPRVIPPEARRKGFPLKPLPWSRQTQSCPSRGPGPRKDPGVSTVHLRDGSGEWEDRQVRVIYSVLHRAWFPGPRCSEFRVTLDPEGTISVVRQKSIEVFPPEETCRDETPGLTLCNETFCRDLHN